MGVLGLDKGEGFLLLKIWGIILLATSAYLLPLLLIKLNPSLFGISTIFYVPTLVFFAPLILLAWLAGIICTIAELYVKLKERKTKTPSHPR